MPFDAQQTARVAEINRALQDDIAGKAKLADDQRRALRAELGRLFDAERAPAPQVDERVEALALRADTLARALHGRTWSSPDRAILSDALANTAQQLPDGAWLPPALSPHAPRPPAILPPAVTRAFADRSAQTGDTLETAIADVERALGGLDPPPAG